MLDRQPAQCLARPADEDSLGYGRLCSVPGQTGRLIDTGISVPVHGITQRACACVHLCSVPGQTVWLGLTSALHSVRASTFIANQLSHQTLHLNPCALTMSHFAAAFSFIKHVARVTSCNQSTDVQVTLVLSYFFRACALLLAFASQVSPPLSLFWLERLWLCCVMHGWSFATARVWLPFAFGERFWHETDCEVSHALALWQ